MKTLHLYLLKRFIPIFLASLSVFVMIIQLMEIFGNIFTYINRGVPFSQILYLQYLYLPRCIAFSLPMALLFSVSFVMGNLYTDNEMLAIFGAGISFFKFVRPLLVTGVILSIGLFIFEDNIAIPFYRDMKDAKDIVLGFNRSTSRADVKFDIDNNVLYMPSSVNTEKNMLSRVTIVYFDNTGVVAERIEAQWAEWRENKWTLYKGNRFRFVGPETRKDVFDELPQEKLVLEPSRFVPLAEKEDDLTTSEILQKVDYLESVGVDNNHLLTSYHQRFSFSITPLLVIIIGASMSGRFRLNILLMTSISSISISVIYYVMQIIGSNMGRYSYAPPVVAAWLGSGLFLIYAATLLFRTRN